MTGSNDSPAINMGSADRCASCGAEMNPDQRYCVECGARRGQARFSLPREHPAAATVPAPAAAAVPRRFSSSTTLLTGLAILLLALGVGVMIGKGGNSLNTAKPYNIVVNSGGGGGTAGSGGSGGGSTTAGTGGGSGKSGGSGSGGGAGLSKTPTASINGNSGPKVNYKSLHTKAQRTTALKKVLNTKVNLSNGKKLAPETQKMGASCTSGEVGCVNGKYTGQFFGN